MLAVESLLFWVVHDRPVFYRRGGISVEESPKWWERKETFRNDYYLNLDAAAAISNESAAPRCWAGPPVEISRTCWRWLESRPTLCKIAGRVMYYIYLDVALMKADDWTVIIRHHDGSIIIKVEHCQHFPFRRFARYLGSIQYRLLHLDWRIELLFLFFHFSVSRFRGDFSRFNYRGPQ